LDEEAILKSLAKTKCMVTLKSIFLVVLAKHIKVFGIKQSCSTRFVAVNDSFESGTPRQLMEKYKLNNQAIVEAVEKS
jgi:transketolase